MKEAGALNAMMSGSGPTVFGIFKTEAKMNQAYDKMKNESIWLNVKRENACSSLKKDINVDVLIIGIQVIVWLTLTAFLIDDCF